MSVSLVLSTFHKSRAHEYRAVMVVEYSTSDEKGGIQIHSGRLLFLDIDRVVDFLVVNRASVPGKGWRGEVIRAQAMKMGGAFDVPLRIGVECRG